MLTIHFRTSENIYLLCCRLVDTRAIGITTCLDINISMASLSKGWLVQVASVYGDAEYERAVFPLITSRMLMVGQLVEWNNLAFHELILVCLLLNNALYLFDISGSLSYFFSRPCLSTFFIKKKTVTDTNLMRPNRA